MGNFLKQNWIWIVGPLVLILLAIGALIFFGGSGDLGEPHYNLM